jgi:hypothetical protein
MCGGPWSAIVSTSSCTEAEDAGTAESVASADARRCIGGVTLFCALPRIDSSTADADALAGIR